MMHKRMICMHIGIRYKTDNMIKTRHHTSLFIFRRFHAAMRDFILNYCGVMYPTNEKSTIGLETSVSFTYTILYVHKRRDLKLLSEWFKT